MRSALVIMAKAPVPGSVKTRLAGLLDAEAAAALHRAFVEDTVAALAASGEDSTERWLACSPAASSPFFHDLAARYPIRLIDQGPGDLGIRMSRLQEAFFARGCARVIFLGSDSPTLPARTVTRAVTFLKQYPVVLGPAEDGGYYLLGTTESTPMLFEDIPWGTPAVLEVTRARLKSMNLPWHELPTWWDVDRPEDLRRLRKVLAARPGLAPQTARALSSTPEPSFSSLGHGR
jgi:rSAM/selenodomain-associated transferase 1